MLHLGGELPGKLTKLNGQWTIIEFTISTSEGCHRVAPELFHVPLEVATPSWIIFLLGCTLVLLLLTSSANGGFVPMHPCKLGVSSPGINALLLVDLHPMFPLAVKATVVSHLAFATSQQWLVRFLLDVVAVKRIGHLDLVNKTCTKVGA